MKIQELYTIFTDSSGITTDSRNIKKGELFFALKGENFNGNKFAKQALEKGASKAIIDDPKLSCEKTIVVPNVLNCLQELATYHRQQLGIPIIALTGTNGKTTTKELINSVLSQKFNCFSTLGNLNNHIGVPLSILSLSKQHEIAVIEMGANHLGEIKQLCEITKPTYGLITNIGKAHLEGFSSFDNIKLAKGELYNYINKEGKCIFVNSDNKDLIEMVEDKTVDVISYGEEIENFCTGTHIEASPFLSFELPNKFCILENPESRVINTRLVGAYNHENALAAACIGMFFGISFQQIKNAIESYSPRNNRSQFLDTKNNKLIIDCYNANPTSMECAIDSFVAINHPKKGLILGDMLELGKDSFSEHKKIIDKLNSHTFTNVYLVGKSFSKQNHGFKCFENIEELKEELEKNKLKDHYILLKGSRGISLEKIIDFL